MPTWGWFIVALVAIDVAVMITWLITKGSPSTSHSSGQRGLSAADADVEIRRLKSEGNATQAIMFLNERAGVPLREAKATVDRL